MGKLKEHIYRPKTAYVAVVQYDGANAREIMQWAASSRVVYMPNRNILYVGYNEVNAGDYIIRAKDGTVISYSKEFFEENYEIVE